MNIGVCSPGEMGAAVGARLRGAGHTVWWASEGRSEDSTGRARAAELLDAGSLAALRARVEVLLSIVPPHAAPTVLDRLEGFGGLVVDLNAVAPDTVRRLATGVPRLVDGSIVGPPPVRAGTTRIYLSGPDANEAAALFAESAVEARVLGDEVGAASALKMVYAAWSKGSAALLLALYAAATYYGVERPLLAEWEQSAPRLVQELGRAAHSGLTKGWRFVGEMEEIAGSFAAAGLPDGFHQAARDVFSRLPREKTAPADGAAAILAALQALLQDGANT